MGRKTSEERKKDIVKATLELIGEKGIESLRTSQIAEKVGFSEAALYKHFSNKKEVVKATIQTAGSELIKSLKNSIENAETEKELVKLRTVLETHMKFIRNHPGITRLLFSDEVHFNQNNLQKELYEIITEYREIIRNLLKDGIENNQVREDLNLDAAFSLYFGMIQSQILFWSFTGGEESLQDQEEELWTLYRRAIAEEDTK